LLRFFWQSESLPRSLAGIRLSSRLAGQVSRWRVSGFHIPGLFRQSWSSEELHGWASGRAGERGSEWSPPACCSLPLIACSHSCSLRVSQSRFLRWHLTIRHRLDESLIFRHSTVAIETAQSGRCEATVFLRRPRREAFTTARIRAALCGIGCSGARCPTEPGGSLSLLPRLMEDWSRKDAGYQTGCTERRDCVWVASRASLAWVGEPERSAAWIRTDPIARSAWRYCHIGLHLRSSILIAFVVRHVAHIYVPSLSRYRYSLMPLSRSQFVGQFTSFTWRILLGLPRSLWSSLSEFFRPVSWFLTFIFGRKTDWFAKTPPNKPDRANRRQPFGFRELAGQRTVRGLTAAVAHPGRSTP